jgi:hypothetical protein
MSGNYTKQELWCDHCDGYTLQETNAEDPNICQICLVCDWEYHLITNEWRSPV